MLARKAGELAAVERLKTQLSAFRDEAHHFHFARIGTHNKRHQLGWMHHGCTLRLKTVPVCMI